METNKNKLFLHAAIVLTIAISFAQNAHGAPTFARQTGLACNACHFQHFPALNEFGRNFKAGGYTLIGGQSLIEGEILSLPAVLNASIITKIRYQQSNGSQDATKTEHRELNRGELQFPDEGALLIGGRVGEHIGFLLEAQLVDEMMSTWASFKMPIVYDVKGIKLSFIPFTTDAGGPAYGFELLNTGAVRMQRILEHRTETSAQQYIGTAREATGFSFVASHDLGYLNYTAWSPEHQFTDARPYLHYIRLALTPNLFGWDTGIGVQIWDGETRYTDDDTETRIKREGEAWAMDFQTQGYMGSIPLGLYFTYGKADKSDSSAPNLFNSSATDDRKAWTGLVEVGVIPGKLTLAASYRDGETGAASNEEQEATTLGATYMLAQNVELQINHTWYDGSWYDLDSNDELRTGDKLLTLMVFAAF